MKHLVECPHCKIQYDATGRDVGSMFHCHCGHAVTVSRPKSAFHLQVVRCSNCGAGREDDAPHCSFCGAEFSLSERDLDLICGHCTERTGSRSRFCHVCGTKIAPLEVVGTAGDLNCPRCSHVQLVVRDLGGGVAVQECDHCMGIWLPKAIFARLETRSIEAGRFKVPTLDLFENKSGGSTRQPYIRCPACDTLMNRANYQKVSGIIIDTCSKDGIWFDAGELAQIVTWLERGGQTVANDKADLMDPRRIAARHAESMQGLSVFPENRPLSQTGSRDVLVTALKIGGSLVRLLAKL